MAKFKCSLRRITYGTKVLELEHDDDDNFDILVTVILLMLICSSYCLIMF